MLYKSCKYSIVLCGLISTGVYAACSTKIDITPSNTMIPIIADNWIDGRGFRILITNMGTESITLVDPGDGSEAGFRTPLVSWSVEDNGEPVVQKFLLDDNQINHLEPGAVFTLAPAESHQFKHSIPPIVVHGPGQYEVEFHYKNEPKREWTGIPMGRHDPATMRQIRDSTPCDLTSAPVRFEAIAPTPQSHE
jgi:hypothetical protein